MLTELGVRFLFSDFECGVLSQLNCAPTQLHPNSWTFVWAFECLMEYLGCYPSLALFFSLFQAKWVWRGGWVNLSSHPGRSVFSLYKQSFKDFKEMFVKVQIEEEFYPFFLNSLMVERFPVYWSPEPKQILDCDDRVKSEEYVLDFLVSAMSSSELLSISSILKLEGDREAMEEYLGNVLCIFCFLWFAFVIVIHAGFFAGEKTSTLTTANLKAFISKARKKEKEGSSTNVRENEVVTGRVTSDVGLKRKRGDGSSKVLDLTGAKEDVGAFTAEEICSAYESQVMLYGYRDGPEQSLWSAGYPFMAVSDEFA
ncbi:uncharacterized protein DS421_14g458140 [Arachis hypogaea]|nr:uncharacterized protein DS421_14g458140 [Arachis hypogaea]